jgi:hypothetical protein
MNDDGIETMLMRMQPAKPSGSLIARLQHACGEIERRPPRPPTGIRRAIAVHAGIAATVTVCVWFSLRPPAGPTTQNSGTAEKTATQERPFLEVFAPVQTRNYLLDAEPAATVHVPNHPPVRVMRILWVDDVLCQSEDGDAALEFTQTREEWVPVTGVVY